MKLKEPFAIVERKVILAKDLSVFDKTVYCVLCTYADNETRSCYPSYTTIAEKANCSKRKVISSIEVLAEKGYIKKEERKTKKGGNRTNVYWLGSGFGGERYSLDMVNGGGVGDEYAELPDALDSVPNADATPELYSVNYIHDNYTQSSIGKNKMDRLTEVKKQFDYDYFEMEFPEQIGFVDAMCAYILELYDEVAEGDKRLLNKASGMELLGFMEEIKGKNFSEVRNIKGYFKKMFVEYLRAEEVLVATADIHRLKVN